MDQREEQFLKDLAWSEVWFPWKKKGILIRKESKGFWEVFAIIVSTLALVVSAIATIGTFRQVDLMRTQLRSAERNEAVKVVLADLKTYCDSLANMPVKEIIAIYRDADGKRYEAPMDERDYYDASLGQRSKVLTDLLMLTPWQDPRREGDIVSGVLKDFESLKTLGDLPFAERAATQVDEVAKCHGIIQRVVSTVSSSWFRD
jgi:hypothetical protein